MSKRIQRIQVKTAYASYPIVIGMNIERELVNVVKKEGANRRVAVISDGTVARLIATRIVSVLKKNGLKTELFTFPAGEKNKNQQIVTKLQHAMLKRKYGRDSLIVALGGGVTGDMAGFVAATYMRGIPYIQVPTTLLAMVDSSVGGKVGIDTPFGKNTVGAFWQPKAVIADAAHLRHLSRKELISGLIEAVKTFFTSDRHMLAVAQRLDLDDPFRTANELQAIIYRSISIKAAIIGRDERESAERLVVNFGHTIGHAIELLSEFRMPHGYAVGYGILVESKIAELLGTISSDEYVSIRDHLKRFGITKAPLSKFSIARVLHVAKTDKKSKSGVPHYVLLSSIGSVYTKGGVYAYPVKESIVRKAYRTV
ncbi:MAG: 3-dehydroquinate synthase [Parcubacteria group bacterium Gr01-1014_8]|nr:MAG: 3-dehydroquinate synthase [Parcubacteria group bacterium Gr01-1014_8]